MTRTKELICESKVNANGRIKKNQSAQSAFWVTASRPTEGLNVGVGGGGGMGERHLSVIFFCR